MGHERKTGLTVIAGLLLAASTSGCASIMNGRSQEVALRSTPPGATVKAGTVQTITPGKLTLSRSEDHEVTFSKEGFPERQARLESTGSAWLLGNVLFGGIIGLVIDLVSGGGFKLTPGSLDVDMETGLVKETAEEPPAAEPAAGGDRT